MNKPILSSTTVWIIFLIFVVCAGIFVYSYNSYVAEANEKIEQMNSEK